MTKTAFIKRMTVACDTAKKKGAVINTPAVVSQAALESGWGNSLLAAAYFNLFGIKRPRDWGGATVTLMTYEWDGKKYIRVPAQWAIFASWNECIVYYSKMIQSRSYYQDALPHADPPHGDGRADRWIHHLVDKDEAGELRWATAPAYTEKVMTIAEEIATLRA